MKQIYSTTFFNTRNNATQLNLSKELFLVSFRSREDIYVPRSAIYNHNTQKTYQDLLLISFSIHQKTYQDLLLISFSIHQKIYQDLLLISFSKNV